MGPSTTERSDGGWEIVGGDARCPSCIKDGAKCLINTTAIDKWRKEQEKGVVRKRHPPHTSCKRCLEKKKGCDLPATRELREAQKNTVPEVAPSIVTTASRASSGRKRFREMEVEMPVPLRVKRRRQASPESAEGEFRKELLFVLRSIDGRLGELVQAARGMAESGSGVRDKGKGKEKADEDAVEVEIVDSRSEDEGRSGKAEKDDGSGGEEEEEEEEDGEVQEMVM